jgi:hypothetical protein
MSTRRADAFLWSVVVEGAADRWCGRPQSQNPYAGGLDAYEAWDWGWQEADWIFDIRATDEVRRWLREAA